MTPVNDQVFQLLRTKAKQNKDATDATFHAFTSLKLILQQIERELKHVMVKEDARIKIQYTDRGTFEAELKVADDVLIFIMHTNAFVFELGHSIWKTGYVSLNKARGTCGMISIYNFLSDAMKYERGGEAGQLVGRIFVNSENHFFVEGKRQIGILHSDYATQVVSEALMQSIVEACLVYSMDIDVNVPPIDAMKEITVSDALNYTIQTAIGETKKLGFKFQNSGDDVEA